MENKDNRTVLFSLGGMLFEYDEIKNQRNIKVHGISFQSAARVFFDYDRIEFYDEENSENEDRYDTIGDISAISADDHKQKHETMIGNVSKFGKEEDIIFVVYTERHRISGKEEVIRLISARYATNFERGLYYGKW